VLSLVLSLASALLWAGTEHGVYFYWQQWEFDAANVDSSLHTEHWLFSADGKLGVAARSDERFITDREPVGLQKFEYSIDEPLGNGRGSLDAPKTHAQACYESHGLLVPAGNYREFLLPAWLPVILFLILPAVRAGGVRPKRRLKLKDWALAHIFASYAACAIIASTESVSAIRHFWDFGIYCFFAPLGIVLFLYAATFHPYTTVLEITFTWMTYAVPMAAVLLWLVCRKGPAKAGVCGICGYDMRATPDRCPECGTIPKPR
jgi:hypothetical protein